MGAKSRFISLLLFFSLTTTAFGRYGYYPIGFGSYCRYYGYSMHASTALEGYYRGLADYVRSLGVYNVETAIAMEHYQEAYRQYLENEIKRVETYYKKRDIHDEWVKNHRKKPPTPEQLAKINAARVPPRLAPEAWDAASSSLKWPIVLRASVFDSSRERLNELFAERMQRPEDSGIDSIGYLQIVQVVDEMTTILKSQIRDLPVSQYIEADRFLRTLSYEARFATGENSFIF